VQSSGGSPRIGWSCRVASRPPRNPGAGVNGTSVRRRLNQTWSNVGERHSVKKLTLSALDATSSNRSSSRPRGTST
jgi:hypothetical protein